MPRALRIQYSNAYYHVMNRGLEKKDIFINEKSYLIFLEILAEACSKFGVIIHSYCLMKNHYHLLVQTPNANLAKFMQYVNGFYTQRYNKFIDRDGPIFKGRFKSILIDKESYLLALGRYIHRNPINFIKDIKNYRWSSYPAYIGIVNKPSWLNIDETLSILGMKNDSLKYTDFVNKDWQSDKQQSLNHIFSTRKNTPQTLGDVNYKR